MGHAAFVHPQPQWIRQSWASLDGAWDFEPSVAEAVTDPRSLSFESRIEVPFAYQWPASGLADASRHDVVWYRRRFDDVRDSAEQRLLLHFGAVDYRCTVWVNGVRAGDHEGGHTPFSFDVTDSLEDGGNELIVRAEDPLEDLHVPRGKQYWEVHDASVFYRPTTGIWQSVWLEPVPAERLLDARFTTDLASATVKVDVSVTASAVGARLRILVSFAGEPVADDLVRVFDVDVSRTLSLLEPAGRVGTQVADHQGLHVWSPESPYLYDVDLELLDAEGGVVDGVRSYFGFRELERRDGQVWLNGRSCPLRLVLDQGYFPGGGLTGTIEDFRRDIELVKGMGFNGVRKHQKVEDPRWLYLADTMGLLVWAEMPSAYRFSDRTVTRLSREWADVILRDRNHPCIIAWVPVNESWGVPEVTCSREQQALVETLVHLTRTLDPTRLVVSNDGWEQTTADLFTIHDYRAPEEITATYEDAEVAVSAVPGGHVLAVPGHEHLGQPIVLSEFGGVSLSDDPDAWGYSVARDAADLEDRVVAFLSAARGASALAGYCYTQLTDVGLETNGLLTFDRAPKVPIEAVRRAVLGD
jgi:beta-galactosidase/beta-glucuronidase